MKNKIKLSFVAIALAIAVTACNSSASETSGNTQDSIPNDSTVVVPRDTVMAPQDSTTLK